MNLYMSYHIITTNYHCDHGGTGEYYIDWVQKIEIETIVSVHMMNWLEMGQKLADMAIPVKVVFM